MKSRSTPLSGATLHGPTACVAWSDGFEAEFACLWLLDNAPEARAGAGGHRTLTAADLAHAGRALGVALEGNRVRLDFEDAAAIWPGDQLRAWAERGAPEPLAGIVPWPLGETLADRPAFAFDEVLDDDRNLKAALTECAIHGLVRISQARGDDAAERLVARFGFIRETNYGRMFDVRVIVDPNHLAYTAVALEPHTDNPYRDPAPTLQLLHCLKSAGEGGATFFVDGFALTQWLRDAYPEDFALLAGHAVPFAFVDANGERYEARSPVIRLDADGQVSGLRFNHRSLGALDQAPADAAAWYAAYLRLAGEAARPERRLSQAMAPGDLVMFDNERILHGRDAFSGAAERWLRGCYAERDGLLATLARLTKATT